MGFYWPLSQVNQQLEEAMISAFGRVYDNAQRYNVSLRLSSYVLAIDKVARTLRLRGIYS
jgi:glutamate dehydrogenase (NAD(P)+)